MYSASIIRGLKDAYDNDPNVAIAYFYFSFNTQETQTTDTLLCSLICQLWTKRPDKPEIISKLDKYEKQNQRPDLETLKEALAAMTCGFSNVYIIVDALDECPNEDGVWKREKLLESLSHLQKKLLPNVHLLCTSRSEPDIEATFRPLITLSNAVLEIDLDSSGCIGLVQHDISLYLDQLFATPNYQFWSDGNKAEAKSVLITKAEGM